MKNSLHKIILSAVVLLNASVAFSQEAPPPPPPTPPPGLPVDAGIAFLIVGALGLAGYYIKNINTKKASN
jgi:hypothetical protein